MDNKSEDNVFTEFYNSARDLILDRISSPLLFSFVIAWMISNYKIIMVVFTNQTEGFVFDYKIQLIQSYLELSHGFFYPLMGACFYTFVYPFIDQKIAKFTLERKMVMRNDKNKIEKAQLLTAEEVKAIHLRHFKIEEDCKSEIERSKTTENQLRTQIDELQGQIKTAKELLSQFRKKGGTLGEVVKNAAKVIEKKSLASLGNGFDKPTSAEVAARQALIGVSK